MPLPRTSRPAGNWSKRALVLGLHLFFAPGAGVNAQVGPPETPRVHALVNARIVQAPGRVIPRGTIVIRDGVIEAVGASVQPPADARIWAADSFTVYAGFIDPYVVPAEPKEERPAGRRGGGRGSPAEPAPEVKGTGHEISKLHPEQHATALLPLDRKLLEERRKAGFTAGHLAASKGVLRGMSAVVSFGDGSPRDEVLRADVAQVAAFETGSWRDSVYPGSLMGVIAVLRQTLADAGWYRAVHDDYALRPAGRERPEINDGLEALGPVVAGRTPMFFVSRDYLNVLRAAGIAREFGIKAVMLGTGHEYKRIDAIGEAGFPLILPVDFPAAPSVKTEVDERAVDTADLRHWALAPGNPAALDGAGILFAFTADGLKDAGDFRTRVREAIERGLDPDRALAACTVNPARILGMAGVAGTIEPGKIASLVMATGDVFAEKTEVREVWIDGDRFEVKEEKDDSRGGESASKAGEKDVEGGSAPAPEAGNRAAAGDASRKDSRVKSAEASLKAAADVAPAGLMGDSEAWRAARPAQPPAVLVKNATIWTSGPHGNLENADLLVKSGKIAAVGRNLSAGADAVVIDATGKHVTPGLIDCHSHSAVSGGVNEGTNNVTAEVRIGDVVNPETINIYRELAGGLTAASILHGSANAIGGQNQVIKLRYGAGADDLKMAGAPPGIKFALGENPKQSNWGIENPTRYPQSRMGVEQLIRERFLAARDYGQAWADFKAGKGPRPKRDLQLETIQEILEGRRLIHSHSYRQDEILMLIRLCDEFGVRIGTFQHVLEGYKVADEIARHGAGASSFSDWWAYKFEVYDAVPYNGAIMHDRGVVVSFNSDSSELSRRMSYEAAKAVKYGGVAEEEALKFVTLNPARQLGVDARIGSLDTGKDADFVIWSGNPLSNLTIAEQTWIDGRKYFDRVEDLKNREAFGKERASLIAWVKKAGGGKKEGGWSDRQHPGYLDEDGTDEACHEDGTDRRLAVEARKEAGR